MNITKRKPQVPEKQNSCKFKQKNIFRGSKLGLNCHLGPPQKVIRNSHIAYNTIIGPCIYTFRMPNSSFWGNCHSCFYPEEIITFFGSGPSWAFFFLRGGGGEGKGVVGRGRRFEAITPVNNVRLKNSNFHRDRTYPKFELFVQP